MPGGPGGGGGGGGGCDPTALLPLLYSAYMAGLYASTLLCILAACPALNIHMAASSL